MAEHVVSLDSGNTPIGTLDANGQALPLAVATGQSVGFSTLTAVTGNATGTTMDCGFARPFVGYVCVGTGTLAGTLTCQGSIDGVTFVSAGVGATLTVAGTVGNMGGGKNFRYYRVNLSGSSGAGTATCLIMAGG